MKIMGLPVVGILGGVGIGVCGLIQFTGDSIPAASTSHRVVAQKPRITFEPNNRPDHPGSIPARDESTDADRSPDAAAQSVAESNLRYKVRLLEHGMATLAKNAEYTATLQKQEVVNGELLDEQTILIKCRHKPFSVYLFWLSGDEGREVIYVEGENNGKMIAHDGGWKSRIPAFWLSPDGMLAMRDSRYPVTEAGLLGLARVMLGVHREDLVRSSVATCELNAHQSFDGRPCYQFTTKYKTAGDSPVYRKSVTLIDREWKVPVHSQHFEWPKSSTAMPEEELDQATLLESYSFTDVKFRRHLSDSDFDRTNPEYHFR